MAEAERPNALSLASKEATLSSGKLTELPTIPQDRSLGEAKPSNPDDLDYASETASPRTKTRDNEPADYLNGGLAHDKVSPLTGNGSPPFAGFDDRSTGAAVSDDAVVTIDPVDLPSPPIGRRSVQFAQNDVVVEPYEHTRHGSWDARDAFGKLRGSAFMSRLKEFTVAGPSSSASRAGLGTEVRSESSSPAVTRQSTRLPRSQDEGSDVDADAEETADEATGAESMPTKKKRRRIRRLKPDNQSAPNTPRFESDASGTFPGRLGFIRRSTMPDVSENRGGLSEGEGRDQLSRERGSRMGMSWIGNRGEEADEIGSPSGRRGQHTRRISVFGGGGVSDGDAMTPKRPFFPGGDRATTFGASKWRQVKSTLKALRQKKDERFDLHKSTELMAELRAGAPAVLMFASMIQRDEHGNKRIPVLLEQLKLRVTDSTPMQDKDSERHWLFTIELEYGSGPSRMRWTIKRTIREVMNLHFKYKLALRNEKFPTVQLNLGARPKQPKFPSAVFPYLRGVRGLDDNDEEDPAEERVDEELGEATAGEQTALEGTGTDVEGRPQPKKKASRINVLGHRRKTSSFPDANGSRADLSQLDPATARRRYVERQRRQLEKYLQEMVRWLIFRVDSNRLCRFLELSALGVRLAAEGSYHGKECYLHIQSSKGLDFRRVLTPGKVIARHSRKWFLVRQSYIVCVESPENMNIYDVYLVDPKFKLISKRHKGNLLTAGGGDTDEDMDNLDPTAGRSAEKHHTLKILTSERKVKLFSRSQHILKQFEESITEMLRQTPWHLRNRFGSFAPVRTGVHAQWLVDGRDYMWNVSRALNMAKDVIYIHDWWLSPELYMRRPAAISQKWRLDRLLQRKAKEGVKIFVIIYRNVEAAIPIDSEYTKFSLLNLHPNIFVQRSPNQFKKNQFFFAHHEKICIVDHDVAFLGGIDLCFGRWDCPQHPVADDKPTGFELQEQPKDAEHCQLFPGKDYSNPRVQDFFRLNEPYEEMYDRSRVPRMPWHDISMQLVGQPVRDLTRHFVQRWNYVRRGRKPTRPTPFLLPPPDYNKEDLDALGLSGTCEVQILRSASTWSLGVEDTEASIQSAYIKMIEESDHFVYVENQFFITSTETLNSKMVNRVGDALVERAIRAHEKDEDWRAMILIPLMPGFQNEVNEQDGTSVRLILQCQYRSICRGEHSIFGRLRAAGIDPEDYIQFFSLRQWGKLGNNLLTTEQLYIHAKCIIVDDRVALIGSANINERSMLGTRDSEVAAIVRDTDMVWSTMAGRPYRVGRFAHTLRLRLMREHLGLDVDEIMEEERVADLDREAAFASEMDQIYDEDEPDVDPLEPRPESSQAKSATSVNTSRPSLHRVSTINHDVDLVEESRHEEQLLKGKEIAGNKSAKVDPEKHRQEVEGFGPDRWKLAQENGVDLGRDSVIVSGREVLVHNISAEGRGTLDSPKAAHELKYPGVAHQDSGLGNDGMPTVPAIDRRTTEQLGLPRANQLPSLPVMDDTDIGGPPVHLDASGKLCQGPSNPANLDVKMVDLHKDCMKDPLNPAFFDEIWCRVAENNTKIFRRVFRVMPDSEATNWAEYKEFKAYNERFKASMEGHRSSEEGEHPRVSTASVAPSPKLAAKPSINERKRASGARADMDEESTALPDAGHLVQGEKTMEETSRGVETKAPISNDAEKAALEAEQTKAGDDEAEVRRTESRRDKERNTGLSAQKPPNSAVGTHENGQQPNDGLTAESSAHGTAKPPGSQKRRRRATTKGSRRGFDPRDDLLNRADAEELLKMTQGTVVQFPYDWLVVEEANGNWLFQVDQVAPLQIYN